MEYQVGTVIDRLAKSKFRSSFQLKGKERNIVKEKGLTTIEQHAFDLIGKRLAPAVIPNDGKQTPMKGHPVFVAQHATATCCRSCLFKWHKIKPGNDLTATEQEYIVQVIMTWIRHQMSEEPNSKLKKAKEWL